MQPRQHPSPPTPAQAVPHDSPTPLLAQLAFALATAHFWAAFPGLMI